ncbi:hypothetical protein N0V90_012510 [Kalmusia sp. IMI 367209]|nr:hypothetical protein N0V90_012510 [Kalmusia sp. IMI 367209]
MEQADEMDMTADNRMQRAVCGPAQEDILIEDRLAGIEHVLEALSNKLGNLDLKGDFEQNSQPRSNKISATRSPRSGSEANNSTPAPFEGETTINRQSEFARELLEQAVGSTPSIEQNAEIKAALTSLQDMVTRQGAYTNMMTTSLTYPFSNKSLADLDHANLERPPWELVNEVIDKASVYPTMSFAVVFPFLKMPNMKDVFRDAFESPADCGVGRRMLVYGVLTSLFYEFSCYPVVDKRVESYRGLARMCERQLECAMSQLDLYLPATYENILALLLGSAHAIEMCKPSLCWTMISTAAHLSQNLGYHRYQTMKDDSEDERNAKIHVFWFIYMMDKTLSLRLGRASIIQDWDMSLPYPNIDSDHARFGSLVQQGQKGTEMLLYWIKVAQIQGKAYEKLFSPAGFLRPMDERALAATELVDSLNRAWSERGEASAFDFAFLGIDYGDSSAKQPIADPNQTGPPSMRKRWRYVFPTRTQQNLRGPDISNSESYEEIEGDFVVSLESCRTISEGADKLYKMCHLFLQVAKLYVEAKTKESVTVTTSPSQPSQSGFYPSGAADSGINLNTMTQFDPYLSALGLMPNAAWPMTGFSTIGTGAETFPPGSFDASMAPSGSGLQPGNPTNVQDWFSGSRYLLGLMEDDIQMPDFSL